MKKLLKTYGLNSDVQYYEICINSYINGQINQCKEQIKALNREQRKQFFIYWMNVSGSDFLSQKSQFFFNQI